MEEIYAIRHTHPRAHSPRDISTWLQSLNITADKKVVQCRCGEHTETFDQYVDGILNPTKIMMHHNKETSPAGAILWTAWAGAAITRWSGGRDYPDRWRKEWYSNLFPRLM